MNNISVRQRTDGYWECEFIDYNGRPIRFVKGDKDTLLKVVEKHIAKYGAYFVNEKKERGPYKPRTRTDKSKQWGRPTTIFNDLRRGFKTATTAAAGIGSVMITADIAEKALKGIYDARGNFNTYTGNLERSYKGTVVYGRKIQRSFFLEGTPAGNKVNMQNRTVKLFKERHSLGYYTQNSYRKYRKQKFKKIRRKPYRYFKLWENEKGYRDRNTILTGRERISGFGRWAGDKYNRVQSGIIVENTAPYSEAVDATKYKVIPPGIGRKYTGIGKQHQLLTAISTRMLKAAKLL